MRFDFHKFKDYLDCPKKYKLRDLRTKILTPRNAYYQVAGELVQKFFEMYSNQWKSQGVTFHREKVRARMKPYWDYLLLNNKVDWSHPMSSLGETDLFLECVDTIMSNLTSLDVYGDTRSEVKLEVTLKSGDVLVGKIDFITETGDKVIISDGKNSASMGKHVDERQLLFYALLYKFRYGKLPNSLKFIYYKHVQEKDIIFSEKDIDDLWRDMIRVIVAIKGAKEFPATPCAKACKYCDYLDQCPEGQKDMASRKRGPKKEKIEGLGEKSPETGVFFITL
jgi:CRISPR/Cas system-associated exonuclease Cas4 (RecB family)